MVAVSDRNWRFLMRLITKRTLLFAPMLVDLGVIVNGSKMRQLQFDKFEKPIAAQIASNDAKNAFLASKICLDLGYEHVNLNVGCPSPSLIACDRGVVLMRKPTTVAQTISGMMKATKEFGSGVVSVKCRVGVEETNSYEQLKEFVEVVSREGGCEHFIIHCRKALLNRNPKFNQTIPSLEYEKLYRLLEDFPKLTFTLNGGITSIEQAKEHLLKGVHSVMIGREAKRKPWIFSKADKMLNELDGIPENNIVEENIILDDVVKQYGDYCERQIIEGVSKIRRLCVPLMPLLPSHARRELNHQLDSKSNCKQLFSALQKSLSINSSERNDGREEKEKEMEEEKMEGEKQEQELNKFVF